MFSTSHTCNSVTLRDRLVHTLGTWRLDVANHCLCCCCCCWCCCCNRPLCLWRLFSSALNAGTIRLSLSYSVSCRHRSYTRRYFRHTRRPAAAASTTAAWRHGRCRRSKQWRGELAPEAVVAPTDVRHDATAGNVGGKQETGRALRSSVGGTRDAVCAQTASVGMATVSGERRRWSNAHLTRWIILLAMNTKKADS